ncbi:cytochrome d ubiquinol oxidase subunit II [Hamadaea flava]|uniref:Cytochrome d ubiquinol oxidase subunit II n=1 Tax=Hamadaea flava TaxID=1742688 RepID=A0ABV8LTH3_9ACTN|nr:cytochrome d ubiquinol oxidase subunit II [Hamadaea flava]MCP2321825.1 cytochrome d ubiquinol oxidase subunit II [Hamadaea flava]
MELTTVWFILIAILWTGYFVLEGFDFGVGMLLPVLGRAHGDRALAERRRRVLINTIGPVWDGNEVWVITAGGATFAAFPEWYATMFSAFYLPLLLILVALIVRGVAFEYRGTRDDPKWRRRWDACIVIGSVVPAFLWGVAFGNIVHGLKIRPKPLPNGPLEYVGSFWDLLNPYSVLAGVTMVLLFLTHGAIFLTLKTTGEVRDHARAVASKAGLLAALFAVAFFAFTFSYRSTGASIVLSVAAVAAFAASLSLIVVRKGQRPGTRKEGWAFAGTAAAIALTVVSLFVALWPNVFPSSLLPEWSLTAQNASSTPYTLKIMTWVAVVFTPLVLLYQGWTYWVFRKRIGVEHIPDGAH